MEERKRQARRKKGPARTKLEPDEVQIMVEEHRRIKTNSTEPPKLITPKEARELAAEYNIHVSLQTIHNWIDKKKLGFQPSGRSGHWRVFRDKFIKHISGEREYHMEVEECHAPTKQQSKQRSR